MLSAVGAGETTFGNLGRRTGLNEGSLSRTLGILTKDVRVVATERPLSGAASRLTHYVVTRTPATPPPSAALPDARIAVDHFHLIMLGNKADTAVRQRVTRELLGAPAPAPTARPGPGGRPGVGQPPASGVGPARG